MHGAYTVRRAERRDLDRLTELMLALQDHLEASDPSLWRMTPDARRQFRTQVASRLHAADSIALVAEHTEAGVVGAIFGRVTAHTRYLPSKAGSIDQLYVDASHRRAGLGTGLVEGLCAFFARAQVDDLTLRYAVGNREAAAFWAHLGFEPRILVVGAARRAVETQASRLATAS
jgi:GNAT superfamily N-acetyltransferase